MSIKRIDSTPRGSKIVINDNTVYLCGQVGDSGEQFTDQANTMLKRVDDLLEKAGTSRRNLLTATVYLSDMRYFDEFNAVWDKWTVPGNGPARACVEARLADPGYLCEVSVTAALND